MDPGPAIELRGVSFSYNGEAVVEDATLRIAAGDFAAVVGPNGGGKTTLLKLILGLLRPDRGQVLVLGGPPERQRPRMGYMPQQSEVDLRFPVTVLDVVLMGRVAVTRWIGPFRRSDRRAALEALDAVEMAEMAARPFADLSGGQRQRALIARAVAGDPKLLLLDEPTSHLDLRVGQEFYALLARLNRRMTVVVVSHDMSFTSPLVRTVVCVQRKVAIHPTEDVTDSMLQALYGGHIHRIRHEHDCRELGCQEGGHA